MTETLAGMGSSKKSAAQEFKDSASADQATIAQLVKAARARGDDLTESHRVWSRLIFGVNRAWVLLGFDVM